MPGPHRHTRRAAATAALLTATLLTLLTGGCAVGGTTSGSATGREAADGSGTSQSGATGATDASSAPASPAAVAQRVGSVVPQDPVEIDLPSGSSVPVRSVSTTANGVLDVPEDIDEAGWWRGGSRLGDPFGSTLIAAHVDSSTQGLGPFAELLDVQEGATVTVHTADLRQQFRVRSLQLRPKGSIGPRSALHSPEGERRLTLVTCAGPYDASRGGYQNLAVVVAVPTGPAVERRGR